jgi:hypothetical protein
MSSSESTAERSLLKQDETRARCEPIAPAQILSPLRPPARDRDFRVAS